MGGIIICFSSCSCSVCLLAGARVKVAGAKVAGSSVYWGLVGNKGIYYIGII